MNDPSDMENLRAAWRDLLRDLDEGAPWARRSFMWLYHQLPGWVWITVGYVVAGVLIVSSLYHSFAS